MALLSKASHGFVIQGVTLEKEQLQKVQNEAAILAELKALET